VTERLYYTDCYLREFRARVVDRGDGGRRVYLDRTAFYPASGGQPFDLGTLGGVPVREVVDEDDRVAHLLEQPLGAEEVPGVIDWTRRFDYMQQHTGQHLLSAVLEELYRFRTVSFHMSGEVSTIDIETASFTREQASRAEERCAELVAQSLPVAVSFEDATGDLGLRKPSGRSGVLRIVSIQGVDRSACGGTHVRSTAEIGPLLIRKMEKIRSAMRLEFVCGLRALRRARADYLLLTETGRALSASPENTPAFVAAQLEKIKTLEKSGARLAAELARREGRELYEAAPVLAGGFRRLTERGPIDDVRRVRAQAFTAGNQAVFLAICEDPPSVLLAASADSGIHAGDRLKAALAAVGGRGGGTATLGQGSVASQEELPAVLERLRDVVP
jgi:alanyl-tRNA synthetase